MKELKLLVPTYNASLFAKQVAAGILPEFGPPNVPVIIRQSDGVRIVLGSHDFNELNVPDVQIERRPRGWAIFLHPLGGSDACAYIYFLDDGRSFLLPETGPTPTPEIQIVARPEIVPEMEEA